MLKRRATDPVLTISLLVVVVFVGIAIVLPLARVIASTLSAEALPLFARFLTTRAFISIIGNTFVLGLVVAALGTLVGFLFAYVQVRVAAPVWLKRFLHVTALIPIVSPPFAVALATIVLFGRNGLISYQLFGIRGEVYGLQGLTFVMVLSFFPTVYLSLRGLLTALDPALDEASINLGASKWHVFRTVTLPMLAPGLAGSFLLLFVEAIADLGNPIAIGGDFGVLASRLYIAIIGEYDILAGAVLSVILLVPAILVYLAQRYWTERASVVSVTGKPTGSPMLLTKSPVTVGLVGLATLVAFLVVLIYGTIVLGSLTVLLGTNNALTLKHFEYVALGYGSEAMIDTTVLSAIATPIAGLLAMVIAWLIVRRQFFGRGALDFLTMLGVAVPGTIFGIGYLLAFNSPIKLAGFTLLPKLTGGAAILGGALAIVMVYIIRSVPAGLRTGAAALQQIDPVIEEASASLGANQTRTFRKITLPLIRPAYLSGLIYSFSRNMTTISAIVFLTTPETKIMTQQILAETDVGRFGNAFAYVVILIGIVLVAIAVLYALIGSSTGTERRTRKA